MEKKEICWNVTTRCNQNCKYCHRFLNIKDLSKEENNRILDNIIESGVNEITWTGGEALLLNGIEELMERSYKNKIKNKLITNGKLLTKEKLDQILPFLDSITLSIDCVDSDINEKLGRGRNHFDVINNILEYLSNKKSNVKLRINTVVNRYNLNHIDNLIAYLNKYNIYSLRVFKFMPLREKAVMNQEEFDITNKEFNSVMEIIKKNSVIKNIESRIKEDMEKKYILILADGSIAVTDDHGDQKLGNALSDPLYKFL